MSATTTPPRSAWRHFPWIICGAIGVVVAVNAAMITTAVNSFPGKLGRNGFDLSNQYNAVIAAQERNEALGWQLDATWRASGITVALKDRAGAVLDGARVTATLRRPLGPPHEQELTLQYAGPGIYAAATPGSLAGQWDLMLTVQRGEDRFTATRRMAPP